MFIRGLENSLLFKSNQNNAKHKQSQAKACQHGCIEPLALVPALAWQRHSAADACTCSVMDDVGDVLLMMWTRTWKNKGNQVCVDDAIELKS